MAESNNKLYRFPKVGWFGGVCAGFAYRFKIQTWIIRCILLFLMLCTQGCFFLAYILLWICMPTAETPEDYKEVCE